MNADVLPLIIIDVRLCLRLGLTLRHLDVGLDDIVLRARRNPLRELSVTVRHQFPLCLFVLRSPDLDGNAGDRMAVRRLAKRYEQAAAQFGFETLSRIDWFGPA